MPFCAALPYRAAVLADETTSSTVVEGFMSSLFPVRKTDGPFSNQILAESREVFRFPSLDIAYQKGSRSRETSECSRTSDAQAITITILFSMKPGWIWDGVRTPHFFMDHGVTPCCCSASIFLYKRYVLWSYVICVQILPIYHVYLIGMWCVPWDMNFTQNCLSLRNQRHVSSGTDREGNKRNFDVSWAAAKKGWRDHSTSTDVMMSFPHGVKDHSICCCNSIFRARKA